MDVMDNKLRTNNDSVAKKLQIVYDRIKRERPWDIRPVNKMYTTAKEKYMIELIKEGQDISDETIAHVVGRCYKYHELNDGKGVCWFGFILTTKEFPYEHFKCRSFHNLNQRLLCHNGGIYYPVDILSDRFGDWQPDETKGEFETKEVYDMIQQKWPERWYEDELHKYTLKHLIKMIEIGDPITKDIKKHIVEGCLRDRHRLDDTYLCVSGFLRRDGTLPLGEDNSGFFYYRNMSRYALNPKFYENTGFRDILVKELRFRKYQTAQQVTSENIGPCMKRVKNIYDRILHRDLISPKVADRIPLTWQEQYLIDSVMLGEDIPNEVIPHVLDGCYTWGHLLTDNYACCRGYILKRNIFSYHDVEECHSHHTLNQDLKCYEGRIYHRCAEEPKGSSTLKSRDMLKLCTKRSGSYKDFRVDRAYSRLPPRPAPPPVDHLDNQPVQLPVAAARQQNAVVANVRQIDRDECRDGAEMAILRNVANNANRYQNVAPPPPDIDI